MTQNITPIILAGGKGSRLWPLTSRSRPKPFLRVASEYSLFQETLRRVEGFAPPVIITEDHNLDRAEKEAKALGILPSFVLEPEGRGTSAALLLAAMTLPDKDTLMLINPSDHVIKDPDMIFPDFICDIMHHAREHILLIGVKPDSPETRYGYIEYDTKQQPPHTVFSFKEKPPLETAREMIAEGQCLWNTGIILYHAGLFLERCAALKPRLFNDVSRAFENGLRSRAVFRPHEQDYLDIQADSIDRAILQRCPDLKCCRLPLPWYDAGCWSTYLRLKFTGKNDD